MGGYVSRSRIEETLLDQKEAEKWIRLFEDQALDELPNGRALGIFPFTPSNLGAISYDLTVGSEAFSLRRAEKIDLTRGSYGIAPGETVLVLSREYLGLSPALGAVTLAKATIMNEGIVLSSAKVEPTWYGCLPVPLTNSSSQTFNLRRGVPFCSLLFFEFDPPIDPEHWLSKATTPHLGERTLEYRPINAVPWRPKRPRAVTQDDMENAVGFGPPFDIVCGMFDYNRRQIIDYMESQWGPNQLQNLKRSIWEEEFQQIKNYREREISLLQEQANILKDQAKTTADALEADRRFHLGLVIPLIIATLGWIIVAIKLLLK